MGPLLLRAGPSTCDCAPAGRSPVPRSNVVGIAKGQIGHDPTSLKAYRPLERNLKDDGRVPLDYGAVTDMALAVGQCFTAGMTVDFELLAVRLVECLNAVLPSKTRVEAQGRHIEFLGSDGSFGRVELDPALWCDDDLGDASESLEYMVERVLDVVQDWVAHVTGDHIWPSSAAFPQGQLPTAFASVRADALHFGYEDSVVRFMPIPLADVVDDLERLSGDRLREGGAS
jgi:hypothetical protein